MHIKLIEQHHSCADGCCDEWWTTLYIDGVEVNEKFIDSESAYEYVLKHIGCIIEQEYKD